MKCLVLIISICLESFRSGIGYQCIGDLNEFTKCLNTTDDPERVPFKVPRDLREKEPLYANVFLLDRFLYIRLTSRYNCHVIML